MWPSLARESLCVDVVVFRWSPGEGNMQRVGKATVVPPQTISKYRTDLSKKSLGARKMSAHEGEVPLADRGG